MIGGLHWLVSAWLMVFVLVTGGIAYAYHRNRRYRDGFCLNVVLCTLLLMAWTGLTVYGPDEWDDGCDIDCEYRQNERESYKLEAERYEQRGIACAESDDNDSGNVCRVRLGTKECATVLPDDDTKTDLGKGELIRCEDLGAAK